MKKLLAILLTISTLLSLCACGGGGEEKPSVDSLVAEHKGDPKLSIEVLDVGFCYATAMGYTKNTMSSTSNGVSKRMIDYYIVEYKPTKENEMLFVVQANITNISDETLKIGQESYGKADFKGIEEELLTIYPYQDLSSIQASSLRPEETTPAVLVCFVDESYPDKFKGCSISVLGATLNYAPGELEVKEKIAFEGPEDFEEILGGEETNTGFGVFDSFSILPDIRGNVTSDFSHAENIGACDDLKISSAQLVAQSANSFVLYVEAENTGVEAMPAVILEYQLQDKRGDVIHDGSIILYDLSPGGTVKGNTVVSGYSSDAVEAAAFLSYKVGDYMTRPGGSKLISGRYIADFREQIVFDAGDIKK